MSDPAFDLAALYAGLRSQRIAADALCRDVTGPVAPGRADLQGPVGTARGTVKAGESPLVASRRELCEDLGIDWHEVQAPAHRWSADSRLGLPRA